jgi:hypothetical protein
MLKFLRRWRQCNSSPTLKFSRAQSQLKQFRGRRFPRTRDVHVSMGNCWDRIKQLRPKRNKTCSKLTAADVCNDAPRQEFFWRYRSGSHSAETARAAESYFATSRLRCSAGSPERCHSMQLALVTGLFACGGFICSMLLVDVSDDFVRALYWPRKSYGSPALATPQRPVTAPAVAQSGTFKSNGEEKNAALQDRRVGNRKPSTSLLSLASAAQNSVLRH